MTEMSLCQANLPFVYLLGHQLGESEVLLRSLCKGEELEHALAKVYDRIASASSELAKTLTDAHGERQKVQTRNQLPNANLHLPHASLYVTTLSVQELDEERRLRHEAEARCEAALEERERLCVEAAEARILYQARGRQILEFRSAREEHDRAGM